MEEKIINELLKLSEKALKKNDVPISAIIVDENGKIISRAYNTRNIKQKTINHAEILAINKANKKLNSWRMNNCTLYVTIEPCDMCKAVIKESRMSHVYYLLPKLPEKNQYNKTTFEKLLSIEKNEEKYQEIINKFWKNMRKMI